MSDVLPLRRSQRTSNLQTAVLEKRRPDRPGRPIDAAVRTVMESRFGYDLSSYAFMRTTMPADRPNYWVRMPTRSDHTWRLARARTRPRQLGAARRWRTNLRTSFSRRTDRLPERTAATGWRLVIQATHSNVMQPARRRRTRREIREGKYVAQLAVATA